MEEPSLMFSPEAEKAREECESKFRQELKDNNPKAPDNYSACRESLIAKGMSVPDYMPDPDEDHIRDSPNEDFTDEEIKLLLMRRVLEMASEMDNPSGKEEQQYLQQVLATSPDAFRQQYAA